MWSGIPSVFVYSIAEGQEMSMWCWAASIKMVFAYYGINKAQSQIVEDTFGDDFDYLPNMPASLQIINDRLTVENAVDNNGLVYRVSSELTLGMPHVERIFTELSFPYHPIILAYRGNEENSGHAVVLTGVYREFLNRNPVITRMRVRDPWPSEENVRNQGLKEYTGTELTDLCNKIVACWFIRASLGHAEIR